MRVEAEPALPAEDRAQIVSVGATIAPDDPAHRAWFDRYRAQHERRLAIDLALVARHLSDGGRILEYGAVPLLLTAALAARDYDVTGLDVAPERFATSIERLGLDVARCDVETERVPFDDAAFDLVLFNELFEHLRLDPIFTLREVRRVLRPGGTLMLSTPNLRSFRGLRNLILHDQGAAASPGIYEQYEKLSSLGHMGHVREYTTREVTDFLTRIGLSVTTVVYRGGHGRGLVGLGERLLPRLRPFISVLATRAA